MKIKSPAFVYTENQLRSMRDRIYFRTNDNVVRHWVRNMIKLLVYHGIYMEDGYGSYINRREERRS